MSGRLSKRFAVEEQVLEVLSGYFSVGGRTVEMECRLVEDLFVESIGLIEIVMALNEWFGVEIPEDAVEEWRTVKDVCDSLNDLV